MLTFSLSRNWGAQKLRRLAEIERHVVVVLMSDYASQSSVGRTVNACTVVGLVALHGDGAKQTDCRRTCRKGRVFEADTLQHLPALSPKDVAERATRVYPAVRAKSASAPSGLRRDSLRMARLAEAHLRRQLA
jgi:hypothetical protein